MGTRKIKRIKRTLRIACDDLAYIGEDGEECHPREGQWIDIRKKTSGQDYATILQLIELYGQEDKDADDLKVMAEMVASLPDIYELLAHKIVAWNWTDLWDDDQAPLPDPTVEVMATIDFETDLMHLVSLIMETEETPKN